MFVATDLARRMADEVNPYSRPAAPRPRQPCRHRATTLRPIGVKRVAIMF
jgi:hypothetical protein